ncbi:LysM peptidoglycan-binding domain-containing protein [Halieaceae bacterium IMCC14734]|uniref:LysM peptidoglycan-binding domain-containing protein n=1 Tax=Candidatus Litorirhabdus singularis TaxID=2518993 RepID=A0ABT3TIT8_9GAMM|nr:FimV/HubP family polar landmark protein [Candidatus Litorirhabdus singularis]MCX2981676.1 LysM peptidoglycan-binding domain-containing protein [Candidatus Litorirhabdus singularis]
MGRKGNLWLAGLLSLSPATASALGLGELTLQSYLNEPLRAEVDLLEIGGLDEGQVRIRLAASEDFERAGVERAYFLTGLKFEIKLDGRDEGRLVITSRDPVREPFLDFLVEARWPNGRLLREYTVLLDLPVLSGEGSDMLVAKRTSGVRSGVDGGVDEVVEPEPEPRESSAQPDYGSDAGDMPQSGAEYLVKRNETLWAIASRARPNGASVQDTMLDIQRLNPNAFIGNNINQLKAGYVLVLPERDQISERAPEEVTAAITQQEQSWLENRASRGEQAAAERSGWTSEPDEQGRLQIDVGDGSTASSSAGGVSARMEDADRASRDNADIRNQIASMQQQLQTLQSLVTLKDDQIAALQTRLAEQRQAPIDELTELEGVVDSTDSTTASDAESAMAEAAVAATEAGSETGMTGAEASDTDTQASAPVAASSSTASSSAAQSDDGGVLGWIMNNLLYAGIALVILLFGIAYNVKNRVSGGGAKTRKADDDDEFANVELGDDGLIVDDLAEESAKESGQRGGAFGGGDDGAYAAQFESGDALAEADIYIAYGRYPQAVELLKNAITADPGNIEYRLKLMEASVEMVDREAYQQQYSDLEAMGDTAALQRARDLLEAVDGGDSWLSGLPDAKVSEPVAAAESPFEDNSEDLDIDFSAADSNADTDDSLNLDLDDGLDFEDLDLDDDTFAESNNLDFGDDEIELDAPVETPAAAGEGDDFDLATMAAGLKEAGSGAAPEREETSGDELDLLAAAQQLDGDGDVESSAVDLMSDDDELDIGIDDDDLMTEFGALEIEEADAGDSVPEYTADEGLGFSAEGEEMATRMDLARAYIDMGDADGARDILNEVVVDGDADQQQEARALLASIE